MCDYCKPVVQQQDRCCSYTGNAGRDLPLGKNLFYPIVHLLLCLSSPIFDFHDLLKSEHVFSEGHKLCLHVICKKNIAIVFYKD